MSKNNVRVFLRCRPLNEREKSHGLHEVVAVEGERREVTVRPSMNHRLDKKFTFDGAFGADSTQAEIYREVRAVPFRLLCVSISSTAALRLTVIFFFEN